MKWFKRKIIKKSFTVYGHLLPHGYYRVGNVFEFQSLDDYLDALMAEGWHIKSIFGKDDGNIIIAERRA